MNFEIIHIWSPECDIETFNPYADPNNFEYPECWNILFEMTIGYDGARSNYQCYVCTLEYIRRHMPYYCDKIIVVDEWNLDKIKDQISSVIRYCTQEKPEDTFKELAKCFYWEFQNHKPYIKK